MKSVCYFDLKVFVSEKKVKGKVRSFTRWQQEKSDQDYRIGVGRSLIYLGGKRQEEKI